MQPTSLSLTARTLYAELRELAMAIGTTENIGLAPGTVVAKTVRGNVYLYFQYRNLDGRTGQAYLGPEGVATRDLLRRIEGRARDRAADLTRLNELRAAFVAAAGFATDHGPMRVLKAFADSGLLRPGPGNAVLVGTHAFNALGNLLGVRWASQMQTHDIDLAGDADIDIALEPVGVSVPEILEQLDAGFIPVPTLDPKSPSTSFRIRGQELRVDLLAPLVGKPSRKPTFIHALNAPAQPLRFLDYLIERTECALVIGRRSVVLANVPTPERFALHKLLLSELRGVAFANKAAKDRMQAAQLLSVLVEEAPDGLKQAKRDLVKRGKGWSDKLARALKKTEPIAPHPVDYIASL